MKSSKNTCIFPKVLLFLFVTFCSVYSVPEINPISPYINKGASLQFQYSNNPFFIEYNYKKNTSANSQYVGYANDIYYSQILRRHLWDIYLAIGSENEKTEHWISAVIFPLRFEYRFKYNLIETGTDKIFRNISISPFFGMTTVCIVHDIGFSMITGHLQLYIGSALGTRKMINQYSYFEVFANPHFLISNYRNLGGGILEGDLIDFLDPDREINFSITKFNFSMPIGIGYKYKNIFIRTGISILATFGGEEKNIAGGKLTVDSYNFPQIPFFAEFGFHFQRFKEQEREKNNEKSELREQRAQERSELRKQRIQERLRRQRAEEFFYIPEK